MINNYVCCEDCEYKDYCHNFDAFFGCSDGRPGVINSQPPCNENENNWIFSIQKDAKLNDNWIFYTFYI